MEKFTKEQLIEHIGKRMDDRRGLLSKATIAPGFREYLEKEVATDEIALAALTAVPAMYCMEKGAALDIDATSTCKSVVEAWADEWNEMQCEHGDDFTAVALYRLPIVEELIK